MGDNRSGKIDLLEKISGIMAEIDTQKDVYLFLHGQMDLKEKAMNALITKGFTNEKVIMALPTKVGSVRN